MKLNFYSKTFLTLRSLRKSLAFCLVAATLLVNNAQGQSATGLNFDGSNDYISIPVKPALNITQYLTIEAWIYPTKSLGVQDVISKSSNTANNSYIFPRTSNGWNSIEFLLNINSAGWKTLKVPFGAEKLNQWHHVAATYDGYTMRIFIDGTQAGSFNFAGTITVNNNPLTIGNQTGFGEYFGGSVDEARIFNRALSACEILNNMNCQLAGTEEGLVAYYKFNQGVSGGANSTETTLTDASTTGANGTLINFGLTAGTPLSNWTDGSSSVSTTICPAFVPATVTVSSPLTAVPVSGTIQLFADGVPGSTYSWTGPNGFTSNLQNPTIEGAGVNNSGTYTVTATYNGCPATASIVITVAPRASGLNFDGADDFVSIPNDPKLNSKTFTVEAWIYPTSGNAALIQDVISKADYVNNSGFKFPKTDDKWNTLTFEMSVDVQWKTLSTTFPSSALDKWNHVAATYDGYFMRIYLNGVLMNTLEVTGNYTPATDSRLIIGNQEGRAEFFKGSVDEARVWTRALSQCEIINNMKTCELNGDNNGIANQVGLGAYYRFNQGLINVNNAAYNTLADSSGNGLHGTLTNFALAGSQSNWIEGKVYGVCDYFPLPTLAASANGSVFQTGSTVKLFAVNGNNDTYTWDGPDSFTSSTQNPELANVQLNQAGTYTVTTPYVNCVVTASTRIKVSDLPQLIADGPTSFCPSGSVNLTSATTGTAYQWYKDDVIINGATDSTYHVTLGGSYSVSVTNGTEVTVSAPLLVTIIPDVTAPVPDVTTLPTINVTAPATVTTIPTATDACAGTITATTNSPLTFTHSGTYTITWIYDDGHGNTATQTQTVEVARPVDVTPPVLTVPSNITVAASPVTCNAVVSFAATATDESEDPTVTITYSQNPNTSFPIGTTTVNVTATDAAGNSSTGSFTVTVTASTVAPITGTTTVCAGSTTTLATTTTGGTWSSANTAVATVDASGVVTGMAAGTTNIIYTNACGVTASAAVTVNALPVAPVVTVSNNCGSATLTASNTTGSVLWSNGATTSSITVSTAGTYTVTQSVNGCTSAAASAVAAPGALPATPVVTVTNNCGSTTLTASSTTGTLLWSNGATTASITVSNAGTYTVTQTINGCTSAAGSGVAAPKAIPSAPVVTVNDNCGTSTLTASSTTGAILWSNGATTASITVSTAGTYSVTQTVNGCTSAAGSGVAAPKAIPATPVITVTDNCGTSTLSTSNTTGSILWSNGATTASITVSNAGTYTVTQTVNGCTSTAGSATAAPKAVPSAPVVTVTDNCGSSTLTASNTTGSVLWSNGATTASITVSSAGTYTATQTVNGCTSAAGSATASPKAVPSAPVVTVANNCGTSTLSTNANGTLAWSNGATTASITVSNAGTYTVTQSVNGCVSAAGSGVAAPKAIPSAPVVTVTDNCGSSTLTASNTTGSILWSNGATTASITVSAAGTYTATQTVNGCVSAAGSAVAAPKATPATPVITVTNNCGSTTLSTNASGTLAWSNGATGSSITVTSGGNYSVTVTNGAGCSATSAVSAVTVNTNPVVAAITGATSVVTGATIQLSNSTSGGVWSSLNTGVATVSNSGVVTGVSVGTATIKYTVTNGSGCSTSVTTTITVTGPTCTVPVFTNAITNIDVNSCTSATAAYTLNVSGTSPVLTYTFSGATTGSGSGTGTGSTFNTGVTNVTVRAQNSCGTVSQSFTVTVKSTTGPIPTVATLPIITGQCSAGLTITNNNNNNSNACNDDCNCCRNTCHCRTSSCKCRDYYNVRSFISYLWSFYFGGWNDDHDCDNDDNGGGSTSTNAPTAKDACTGATIVGTTQDPLNYTTQGTHTIRWTYTDSKGNVTTQTQTVIVNDTQAPVATASTLPTLSGICSVTVTNRPTASDNCAGTITGTTTDPLTYSEQGTYTIHWTYTDGNGNTTTQNQTVIVKDVTAPVPQVSYLPAISGSCGLTITSIPKANDNCAGVITATTTDPLTYSAKGTYTIRWTYNDGNGNTTTQNQTVNITGGPVATIVASAASNDFCSDLVLNGSSNTSGASYKWMLGNNVVGTSSQYSLGQNSAEGTYQLYVTANGCTSSAATYTYGKQNLLSSYTILASKTVVMGKYTKVASGSVGVTSPYGYAYFKGSTAVNGDGSFVMAPSIYKSYSDNISRTITGVASVNGIPDMQYNTSSANYYSNYSTASYSTVTLSGNYKTLTIRKGTYATLSGTIFGTIDLEEGASVRFTNSTINIDKLLVEDGARDGYYSYVRFAPNSSVRVSTQVSIGSQVLVNPDNYKVTFYMGDKSCDSERFTVSGADTKVIANIIMPKGKLFVTSTDANDDYHGNCGHGSHNSWNCPHKNHNHKACDHRSHNTSDCNDDVYMTGTFIVEDVESKGNTVIWNSFECGAASVPVTVVNKSDPAPATVSTTTSVTAETFKVPTTEEELKITVMPNPSTTYFTLKFESKYETPVSMRVMDANGRVVDAQTKIGSNSTIRVGANYASGTYFAEMIQGKTRKVIQLIKVRG